MKSVFFFHPYVGSRPDQQAGQACMASSFAHLTIPMALWFLETGSQCVALASLQLVIRTRLASNLKQSSCLRLPSAGIMGTVSSDQPPPLVLVSRRGVQPHASARAFPQELLFP